MSWFARAISYLDDEVDVTTALLGTFLLVGVVGVALLVIAYVWC